MFIFIFNNSSYAKEQSKETVLSRYVKCYGRTVAYSAKGPCSLQLSEGVASTHTLDTNEASNQNISIIALVCL